MVVEMVRVIAFDEGKYAVAFQVFHYWAAGGAVSGILSGYLLSGGSPSMFNLVATFCLLFGVTMAFVFATIVMLAGFYTVEVKEVRKK